MGVTLIAVHIGATSAPEAELGAENTPCSHRQMESFDMIPSCRHPALVVTSRQQTIFCWSMLLKSKQHEASRVCAKRPAHTLMQRC